MNHRQSPFPFPALLSCMTLCAIPTMARAQSLISNFDNSSEGWTVETHSDPSGAFNFISTFSPDFVPASGESGGYISEVDPDNNWSFFRAPLSWSGNHSDLAGGTLQYSTRTSANNYPDGRLVILIGNDGLEVSANLGIPEINVWTHRSVQLSEGPWYIGTNAGGTPATQSNINAVLTDLEALYIGLEFGGELAEELVDLDSVMLSNCPADLTGDGTLNFFDVSAFLLAFSAMDPAADFNNDGTWNFFDVSQFLSLYAMGCPL